MPDFSVLFGPQSLGAPGLMEWLFDAGQWSILQGVDEPWILQLAFATWMAGTVSLLLGWNTRLSACLVWVLSVSFTNCNIHAINAGDSIRNLLLLYLLISPCGAAWSLDAKARRRATGNHGATLIHPWALRLLCVQLAFIYCASGVCKLTGESWVQGESLHYVLGNVCLTRTAFWTLPIPAVVNQLMTWVVLAWEVSFPVLILVPRTRKAALLLGVLFHIGIFVTMEIGWFPFYMLAFYVPLLKLKFPGSN